MRVLVVDDHPLFREGLTIAVETMPDVEVVGEAGDGDAAVEAVGRLAPDVVMMDLHMPGTNGIDATRRIVAEHPDVSVLVLTMLDGDDSVFAAMRAGARGYLLKGADRQEIARALRSVAAGEVVFSAAIASRVLAWFARGGRTTPAPFPELTDREREILDLVAHGLTNPAIARRLHLSDKTVRNHVSNVFTKLHVADRAEAVARARDAGLGTGPL
ncbi:response regulator transcription factor [Frankia sp. CNm7]|uniref:Response regulator transcription factor n=1 Tax=Frankia nepalensis TaxID=1836974 RepID=A0A937UM64_9ACTN|nr:response regulator transcription factor [Frankia nepalensis]MBL7494800.1 response regulator transcription factor [Frankia nepalensis]MBL7514097.1 response regulator transcription factor [Frankia nepalensis]MBL7523244.1 response regulator transcription factor [Frankia nepalensis]MBL7626522.1 response regulator transcription factor [Frankia nepalensis]